MNKLINLFKFIVAWWETEREMELEAQQEYPEVYETPEEQEPQNELTAREIETNLTKQIMIHLDGQNLSPLRQTAVAAGCLSAALLKHRREHGIGQAIEQLTMVYNNIKDVQINWCGVDFQNGACDRDGRIYRK